MEKLNCVATECYPSRYQDAEDTKTDTKKSKLVVSSTSPQVGWTSPTWQDSFGWTDNEAKLNSQFSRTVRPNAYPPSGPPSRPIPQETLRRWENCAQEGTYMTNHAAGFSCYTIEIQQHMSNYINLLQDSLVNGKVPAKIMSAAPK